MAVLFIVLLLYLIPVWLKNPADIQAFMLSLAVALILDTASGFLRYKRFVCSVSAAVTSAVLHVITPGIPLWCRLLGIFFAIVIAKQIWGGTGKNVMNPAILGYLFISFFYPAKYLPVEPSVLLIPALVLSPQFSVFRPFVSLGYFIGCLAAYLTGDISSWQILLVNSLFFGCIVLTDPVTVTSMKIAGFIGGFLVGLLPWMTGDPAIAFPLMILVFNIASYLIDDYFNIAQRKLFCPHIRIKKLYRETELSGHPINPADTQDISRQNTSENSDLLLESLTPEIILERIETNGVYGLGGAGFPTADKIRAVISSNSPQKTFIINGAECDPGLVHDKWLLRNKSEDIYKGICAISRCIGFSEIILAAKDTDGLSFPENIKIKRVGDYYPVGFEKTLIKCVLKKKIPVDFMPAKLGILVLNVQTVLAVYEAVFLNRKVDEKYVTCANLKTGIANVIRVKNGSRIIDIAETIFPGGYPVFAGGGLMQAHMIEPDETVGRNTNFIAVSEMPRYKESPFCSNCNICTLICPQGLIVKRIAELMDQGKHDKVNKYRPENCIKCGLCSYVSLCGKNLSARVWEAKQKAEAK